MTLELTQPLTEISTSSICVTAAWVFEIFAANNKLEPILLCFADRASQYNLSN